MANVLTDPGFESNVNDVAAATGSTNVTRTTTSPRTGSGAALWARTGGSGNMTLTTPVGTSGFAAAPGQVWSAGAYQQLVAGTGRQIRCDIRFYNSSGTDIGGTNGGSPPTANGTYALTSVEGVTAPALTAFASMRLVALSTASGNQFRIDDVVFGQGATLADVTTSPPGQGSGTGTVAWSGSAVGKRTPKASGTGTVAWTGTATGKRTPKGSGTGTVAYTGTAAGTRTSKGSGTGSVTYTGTATGQRVPKATATGSTVWVGTATGARTPKGSGSGTVTWTGDAIGNAPTVGGAEGSGTGNLAWLGTATGHRQPLGTGAGSLAYTGTAAGLMAAVGVGAGLLEWVGAAVGENNETEPFREVTLVGALPPDYTATQVTVELTANILPDTHTATPLDPDTATSRALPATHTARRLP